MVRSDFMLLEALDAGIERNCQESEVLQFENSMNTPKAFANQPRGSAHALPESGLN